MSRDVSVLSPPSIFTFHSPTKVIHGRGALSSLGTEVSAIAARPLVVTDPGIRASGVLAQVQSALEARSLSVAVFDGVTHMATVSSAEAGARAGLAHTFDSVVGVGGGSALAVARGVAILGAMGGRIADHVGRPLRALPLFSVPTTAGSGSEVSPSAPLLDQDRGAKVTLTGPACFARVAILDADLLASLPARQAALSGVDALAHAIEAVCTNLATPITDALAYAAMSTLAADLRAAVAGDGEARARCLVASTMANQACGNAKLGLVHGLARNVQTLFSMPYGVTIGVFLVPVMTFNAPAVPERFARMAAAMGGGGGAPRGAGGATSGDTVTSRDAVTVVKSLLSDIDIPRRFEASVVDRTRVPLMARMVFARNTDAAVDPNALAALDVSGYAPSPNVRRARYDDLVRLYEASLDGWER